MPDALDFPSHATILARVLHEHRPSATRYCVGCDYAKAGAQSITVDPEHFPDVAVAAWTEACTVRTVEQLNALPFLTLVREIFRSSPGSGCDYGGVWERRTSGWHALAGSVMPPGHDKPRLPATLLHHPGWHTRPGQGENRG